MHLTWDCVDWENSRLHIRSPKTEHHAGKATRTIPLFPELRPYLDEAFEQAEEGGSAFVITRYRDTNMNLRTQLNRILDRAGLEAWPKLFQNLRSTRETELAEEYPIQVVCSWIGNSASVATKHYLQVTDEHFEKATQNPTQTMHDSSDSEGQQSQKGVKKSEKDTIVNLSHLFANLQVAREGLEPPTKGL